MRDQDLAILTKAKELGVLPSESTLEDLQASRRGVFHELVKRGVETIPFPGGEIKLKGTFSPRQ
ncbi:MAG TPA: hypothetical protein VFQ60_02575 [Patescibacteria group bacterium]|nr:hypothetical protein [Patescibacteria group bacterium]